ncbi:MAG: GGDEF domain-containing protein [Bacilli bacterium]|nr:GGDEF domain-containing protein [Bacilli bacterium]
MKNKKIIIVSIIVILLIISGGYYILTKENSKTTLNLLEKKWIEDNKNTIVDFGITNNIPVFSYSGKGIIFDFLTSLENDTELEFNKVSYQLSDNVTSEYSFKVTDEVSDNDIVIYEDNYALITKSVIKYDSLEAITNLNIGVLEDDLDLVNEYLNTNANITIKTYKKVDDLVNDIVSEEAINAIILPKSIYLEQIVSNDLSVAYNITEMIKYYVLELGNTEKLNIILTKYYQKWSKENYENLFNTYFTNNYFSYAGVDDKEIVKFRSKRYSYGLVENKPYDTIINNKLYGINSDIIKSFAALANIEISYNTFDNTSSLLKVFNANEIDFMFNYNANNTYLMDVYETVSNYDEDVVIVSNISNDITINSLQSLDDKNVLALNGSQIASYLSEQGISVKNYETMDELINSIDKNSIIALDKITYSYYAKQKLNNYKIDYAFTLNSDYKFVIRDIQDNELFINYFNFYLGFINETSFINNAYLELYSVKINNFSIINILEYLSLVLITSGLTIMFLKRKPKIKDKKITKEGKLKYIDQLTSLKNRNYLNDNIESWDNSEIYPQTIIIVDLNNIAYINDNYGHNEGDKVIREAANILIRNQVENSDIIRTNGNEFLLYLVGYDEKQIVAYMRKLSKDFKEISHGFGAALGYSVITDGIKTIDDAVNEATAAMRDNKEGFNN